jgi:hypothetical protein
MPETNLISRTGLPNIAQKAEKAAATAAKKKMRQLELRFLNPGNPMMKRVIRQKNIP